MDNVDAPGLDTWQEQEWRRVSFFFFVFGLGGGVGGGLGWVGGFWRGWMLDDLG